MRALHLDAVGPSMLICLISPIEAIEVWMVPNPSVDKQRIAQVQNSPTTFQPVIRRNKEAAEWEPVLMCQGAIPHFERLLLTSKVS